MVAPRALTPPRGSALRRVPGDAWRPLVGHTFDDLPDQLAWARSRHARYGAVSWSPSLLRRATRDTGVGGDFVPESALVAVDPGLTHRLEQHVPDPDRFDPERFAAGHGDHAGRCWAHVPFGGGVHRSSGMHFARIEVALVMHQILQRFRWSVDPAYVMPCDTTALPTPADDLPIGLERLA